jgi:hypothetical protein
MDGSALKHQGDKVFFADLFVVSGTQPWLTKLLISVNATANLANQKVRMGCLYRYCCERERKREPSCSESACPSYQHLPCTSDSFVYDHDWQGIQQQATTL